MEIDVGLRLKSLRMSKGFSQRQLALRAGMTNGMISKIEQNQSSPSIASLKKILDGLSISLAEFFDVAVRDKTDFFYPKEELLEINPGRIYANGSAKGLKALSLRQVGNNTDGNIQMLHEHYEPGADTGKELYTHTGEEAGLVIEGEIEITVGKQIRILKAGDAYRFDSQNPHRFRNIGENVCILISACTPPSF